MNFEDFWISYCGNLSPPTSVRKNASSFAPNHLLGLSCYKDLCITTIHIALLIIFWSNLVVKWGSKAGYLNALKQQKTFYKMLSLVTAAFGAFHLVLGLVEAGENWQHCHCLAHWHQWFMLLSQGLAWLTLGYTITIRATRKIEGLFIRFWWCMAFVLGTVQGVSSVSSWIEDGGISVSSLLSCASWPVSCAIGFSTWKIDLDSKETATLKEPLLNEGSISTSNNVKVLNVSLFARAGFLSKLTFWWLNPLLAKGRKKLLEEGDLPNVSPEDQAKGSYLAFSEQLTKTSKLNGHDDTHSIMWPLLNNHKRRLALTAICAFAKICALSCGPLFLHAFIKYAEAKESSNYEGFILVGILFTSKILESLAERQWYFGTRRIGIQARAAVIAAIYKKQLNLSHSARQTHTAGEINNYMCVDAYRIGEFPFWFHQTWTILLQLFFSILILLYTIGWATLVVLVVVILVVSLNTPVAKLQHKFQTNLMRVQDERLRAMSEALCHIRVLKLHGWEVPFKKTIEKLRDEEFKWLSKIQFKRAYSSLLFWSCPTLATPLAFVTCYLLGLPLNASNVFTVIATFRLVQDPICNIPDVIAITIQASVSLSRIENFLSAPELQREAVEHNLFQSDEKCISIISATLSWDMNASKHTLRNINMEVKPTQKVAVCGEVGSGKSTLLASILGEVPKLKGQIQIWGRMAYVSQTAWIQTGTIRENILFGRPFEEQRYHYVIEKCLLVKDLESLAFGDHTQIGERGVNLSGGQKQRIQLARALYEDADIYLLDDPLSAVDADTASSLFEEYMMEALAGKTVILVTHQVDFLPPFDAIMILVDGKISQVGKYDDLLLSSSEFKELVSANKDAMNPAGSNLVSNKYKGSIEGGEIQSCNSKDISSNEKLCHVNQLIQQEEKEVGDTGFKPYNDYLKQNNGFLYTFLCGFFHFMFLMIQISQNTWIASNVENPNVTTLKLIIVYSTLGLIGLICIMLRSVTTAILGLNASRSFFAELTKSLMRAPMSFFDSTPLGRVLTRVSSDMSILDLDIPFSMVFALCAAMNVYATVGVIGVVTWQVMVVVLPMLYLVMQLQKYYFSSAKEFMRINGTTRSPMANHLGESITGGMTIRAFKAEEQFFKKSLHLTDLNAIPLFHTYSANEWLTLRLEFLSATIICSSALAMVLQRSSSLNPSFIGMALSYGLSLSYSVVLRSHYECNIANNIVSVERIKQYTNIPSEAPQVIDDHRPPDDWPSAGRVELHDIKVRYTSESPLILKGITCAFESGHKIGVVGRTGSGKSTLISAVFRLVELSGGKIIIDGIDIKSIGLCDLRSRIGIIPQEPTLFNGTIRMNLDPLSEFSDITIWNALDTCQLGDIVRGKLNGLDSAVGDDGNNWSIGQRQLFCLGRALLRRSKILVMDEATASIDNVTDSILQKTIRREFRDCTVITVAHRIPTVIQSDMILAISDGKIVEYDKPLRLVEKEGSLFKKLVSEYWSYSSTVQADVVVMK